MNTTRSAESDASSPSGETTYRERLGRRSLLSDREQDEEAPSAETQPDVEALRALIERVGQEGSAFQSVAVAAVQILERALSYEREAADAALSLGQQEKLRSMVETAEQAVALLRSTLNSQGSGNVIHLCGQGEPPTPTDNQPWWFALTDALEVLEEGTGRMTSLTTAQAEGSPACELSRVVAQLLREHHDALLLEADEWIS
jgi:hypothetical protein